MKVTLFTGRNPRPGPDSGFLGVLFGVLSLFRHFCSELPTFTPSYATLARFLLFCPLSGPIPSLLDHFLARFRHFWTTFWPDSVTFGPIPGFLGFHGLSFGPIPGFLGFPRVYLGPIPGFLASRGYNRARFQASRRFPGDAGSITSQLDTASGYLACH